MAAVLNKEEKSLTKLVDEYKKTIKTKGDLKEWSDAFLLKFRDKWRVAARKTRGHWTFDFYETLQNINKESIKRDLKPGTN
jgi:hypothetical protein